MGTTNFDSISLSGSITMSGGVLNAPSSSSAPSSPSVGDMYYDSTLAKFRVYQASGWANVDGTAAASLDAAYNGGATITVDAGAVTLTDSQTGAGGGLLITKSGVITGSSSASVFHINSTGAHDTSGDVKFLEISVGSETISGTVYGMEVNMNADSDSALTATKGSVTLTDGDFTMSAAGRTSTNGFSVTTANTSGDGIIFNIDSLTSGDGVVIDGDATGGAVKYLAIQEGSTNIFTIDDDDVYSTKPVEIDVDDANAFIVTEAGDTTVFNIDTTQDAADTTALVDSKTTTGYALHIESDTTTGAALRIDADAVTSGDAIQISIASGTMTSAGAAISVRDSSNSNAEVFAVRDDGTVVMSGTAEGTDVLTTTTGDITITDGDLTLSGGEVSITDGVTTTGSGLLVTSSMTTAGASAGAAGALTVIADSATTGTVVAVRADAITTGELLYLDAGGATMTGAGRFIHAVDDDTTKFSVASDGATVITGTASGTDALTLTAGDITLTSGGLTMTVGDAVLTDGSLSITDADNAASLSVVNNTATTADQIVSVSSTSITTGALMTLNANTAAHDGEVLEIISAGDATSTPVGMSVTIASPTTGAARGIEVTMAAATTTAKGIAVTMDALTTGDMLYLDNGGGSLTGDGKFINCNDDNVSDFAVAADGATTITQEVATSTGLKIDGIWTSGYAVHLDNASGVQADNTAMLFLDAGGNNASGSNIVRLAPTGTPVEGSIGLEFVGAGKVMQAMSIDGDSVNNSVVLMNGGGAIANNKAVLEVTADGTMVAGSSLVRIASSTAAGGATVYGLEIACNASNLEGLYVSAGTSQFDEAVTVGGLLTASVGMTQTAVSRTPTADGTGTGTIAAGTSMVDVTGGTNANCWLTLPTPSVGHVIWLVGTSGTNFEVRTNQPATVAINGGTDTNGESSVASGSTCRLVCTSATTWIGTQWTAAGTESPMTVAAD